MKKEGGNKYLLSFVFSCLASLSFLPCVIHSFRVSVCACARRCGKQLMEMMVMILLAAEFASCVVKSLYYVETEETEGSLSLSGRGSGAS